MPQIIAAAEIEQPRNPSQLGSAAGQVLRKLWSRHWEIVLRRDTRMLLHALDDRSLKDIGLLRSEIDDVITKLVRSGVE